MLPAHRGAGRSKEAFVDDLNVETDARPSSGHVDDGFAPVKDAFDAMLRSDPGFSAQVVAIRHGRVVVDLVGGPHLDSDSVTGVFSSTKGIAATVIGLLLDRGALDLDTPVAAYWPEFAAAGKAHITVRDALTHRAGLIGVVQGFTPAELANSSFAAAKLAANPPFWQPGTAHGYHALTIGVLMEELVRRTTGRTLQDIYESEVRAPRAIDFFLGLPESEEPRFRPVLPPAAQGDVAPAPLPSDTIQSVAFNVLHSALAVDAGDMGPNRRTMREAGSSAINGIGSARGLAGVYAAVLGAPHEEPLVSAKTVDEMSRQHSFGIDRVLGHQTSFGVVYMKPHPLMEFGSFRAFGHDGMGGALAFADPLYGLAFGYVPMPMQPPGGADPKAVQLSQIVRACIRDLSR
jgi:CubicO group peptidase (beta-lactamase class C family)